MSTETALSAAKLAANRANAQRSTGPATPEGKTRASRNSLKHGYYAEASRETMLALGEDPEAFAQLHNDLAEAYQPSDAIARALVEDLAKLYWRQRRWERAADGLLRAERRQRELEQRADAEGRAYDAATIPHETFRQYGLRYRPHLPEKYAKLLEWLEMLRARAEHGDFSEDLSSLFELIYGDRPLWRAEMIWFLWRALRGAHYTGKELPGTVRQLLLKELDEEIASIRRWSEDAKPVQAELAAAERDARLMPHDRHWEWMMQQGSALDRAIDRKIRLLLDYEKRKSAKQESRSQKQEDRSREPEEGIGYRLQGTGKSEAQDIKIEETNPTTALESAEAQSREVGQSGDNLSSDRHNSPAGATKMRYDSPSK